MRAASYFALFLSTPLVAETWQLDPNARIRAADVYLSTRNPADQYGSTYKSLEGGLNLKREDQTSVWTTHGSLEQAEANDAPSGALDFGSRYLTKSKTEATNVDFSFHHAHGFDPITRPIEQAAVKDSNAFESLYAGAFHQIMLDPRNDLSIYLGLGKNAEAGNQTQSQDLQLSWDQHHSVAWTSRIRARITDAGSKQREIMQEHILRLDQKLSAEASYGYGWQINDNEHTGGVLWGLALQYQTTGLALSQSAYEALAPAKQISTEQTDSLRGAALYRLGWTHSRDQRRVGDPFFYADILYGTARLDFVGRQGLALKASQERASEERLFDTEGNFKSELGEISYDWTHRFWSRYPDATLAAGYSVEVTELASRRYFREIYQLSYKLIW